jgi:CHASE2 domain-containing sensor protein/signal transduction histidine kinase
VSEAAQHRTRFWREWLLVTVLLAAAVLACGYLGAAQRADQALYDLALRLWRRPILEDIVIVAVDDDSLATIGRWPWRRAIHATLINRLTDAGARVVGLDIILTEPDVADARSDASLAQALRRNGNVVLPVVQLTWGRAWIDEQKPIPLFAQAAAALGHAHVELDSDGIARTIHLYEGLREPGYPHFALAILQLIEPERFRYPGGSTEADRERGAGSWIKRQPLHVPYAGGPGHVEPVSYGDVLRGAVPPETFRDKIVLVGATAVGLGDDYPTPASGSSGAMSGVEINANVIDALRRSIHIEIATPAMAGLVGAAATVLLLAGLRSASSRAGLLAALAAIAFIAAGAALLLRLGQIWVPPSSALLGCALAYPLWAWRRLEAAQRYLDDELQRLNSEPALLGRSVETSQRSGDPLQRRIEEVRAAAQRSRDTRRFIIDSGDSLPVGVLVADLRQRVVLANRRAARLLRDDVDLPLVGSDLLELLASLRWPGASQLPALLAHARRESAPSRLELSTADGRTLLVEIAPCRAAAGELLGYVVSLDDISELRAAQQGREEAMRFLSHDLRAPLASIITLVDAAQDAPDAEGAASLSDRVARLARNALGLADDMLRLARAEAADPRRFVPVDLVAVIAEAADQAWPLARRRGVTIGQHAAQVGEEALVMGDAELLRRALVNLLTNAVRFSHEGGRVETSVQARGGRWQISIADQGWGIAPENLPKLFTRFARFGPPGAPESEGTGLGLVIVKTAVERHGGKIEVASEPGRGTCFTLTFPAATVS